MSEVTRFYFSTVDAVSHMSSAPIPLFRFLKMGGIYYYVGKCESVVFCDTHLFGMLPYDTFRYPLVLVIGLDDATSRLALVCAWGYSCRFFTFSSFLIHHFPIILCVLVCFVFQVVT